MKVVAEVIGVSRSNLIERLRDRPKKRLGRPPLPDDELVADIKAVIAELPTYGYRRVHAILRRQALAAGRNPPNHKRVYRVMKVYGLLLDRHVGGVERRHDGRIAEGCRMARTQRFRHFGVADRRTKLCDAVIYRVENRNDVGRIFRRAEQWTVDSRSDCACRWRSRREDNALRPPNPRS